MTDSRGLLTGTLLLLCAATASAQERSPFADIPERPTVSGQDPLGLGGLAERILRTTQEWFEASADLEFPAAPYQIGQAFAANADLDVTLCARSGYNFAAGDHHLHSDHGHLRRDSLRLTVVVSGPDVTPGVVATPVRSVDILPTVLDLGGTFSRRRRPSPSRVPVSTRLLASSTSYAAPAAGWP